MTLESVPSQTNKKHHSRQHLIRWQICQLIVWFEGRDNHDIKSIVVKNIPANFAILMKAVKASLNDVKGKLCSTYYLKYFNFFNCVAYFSLQIALGLRFQIIPKKI